MPDLESAVVAQLDDLLGIYGNRDDETNYYTLRTRLLAALKRLAPPDSSYLSDAEGALQEIADLVQTVDRLAAIVQALRDDYYKGYVRTIEELVRAGLFSDFLDMASELLDKGFKDPAAVLAGSVLEEHLRKLAGRNGVDVVGSDGKPRKADAINADLGKAAYNMLDQKSVTAWLDLRNRAAHGPARPTSLSGSAAGRPGPPRKRVQADASWIRTSGTFVVGAPSSQHPSATIPYRAATSIRRVRSGRLAAQVADHLEESRDAAARRPAEDGRRPCARVAARGNRVGPRVLRANRSSARYHR